MQFIPVTMTDGSVVWVVAPADATREDIISAVFGLGRTGFFGVSGTGGRLEVQSVGTAVERIPKEAQVAQVRSPIPILGAAGAAGAEGLVDGQIIPNQVQVGAPPADARESDLPFGAFASALQGLGISATRGPFAGSVASQFAPAEAAFLAQRGLAAPTPEFDVGPSRFEDFISQVGLGGIPGAAASGFRGLLGPTAAGTPEQSQLLDRFRLGGSREDRTLAANLARGASASRLGNFAAARLLPQARDLAAQGQQFLFENPQGSFLDFLRQNVGLPQGF